MKSISPYVRICLSIFLVGIISGCDFWSNSPLPKVASAERVSISDQIITNLEAPIPSQCYTKTENRHNPCYTCHQIYDRSKGEFRMNQLDDGGLQAVIFFQRTGYPITGVICLLIAGSGWSKSAMKPSKPM